VVGDGAVGLSAVLAARMKGADRIIALSRHADRQAIAMSFGATDIVAARGEDAVEVVRELTGGIGADAVLECVGTEESMTTAIGIARAGATVGFIGLPHGSGVPLGRMFRHNIGLAGGVAPSRLYTPALIEAVLAGEITPGDVFDRRMSFEELPTAYVEMNERRAVIVGICETSAPFQSFPVVVATYSQATQFIARERKQLSFVVGAPVAGVTPTEACRRIKAATGFEALTYDQFVWQTINYYMANTGIPVNFGITIVLGFIVGAAIAGQTFYLFTLENLRHFGALKAMGVNNRRLIGMVLLQAAIIGAVGYSLGVGMAVAFFEISGRALPDLRGINIPWQVALGTAGVVVAIITFASLMSLRRVLLLEPAVVFRG
jgi:hypothetical protein